LGKDEGSLKVPPGIMHGLVDRARPEHALKRVDLPVVNDDPPIRINLANLLELATAGVVRLDAGAHRSPPARRP
jgi:hypothetical protein